MKKILTVLLFIFSVFIFCIAASPRMHRDWQAVAASRSTASAGTLPNPSLLYYEHLIDESISNKVVDTSDSGAQTGNIAGSAWINSSTGRYYSGAASQYVYPTSTSFMNGKSQITMGAWIMMLSHTDYQCVMSTRGSDGLTGIDERPTDGQMNFQVEDSPVKSYAITAAGVVTTGIWYRVVATYISGSGVSKIYINGNDATDASSTAYSGVTRQNDEFYVGTDDYDINGFTWHGYIDDEFVTTNYYSDADVLLDWQIESAKHEKGY